MMQSQWALVVALVAGPLLVHAQQDTVVQTQQRLDGLRQEQTRQKQEEESACHQRFAVNDCLKSVQTRHREQLADIRKQEAGLHDLQRRQRADEQIQQARERSQERALQLQEQQTAADRSVREKRPQNTEVRGNAVPSVPERAAHSVAKEPSAEARRAHAKKLRDVEDRRAARDRRAKEQAAGRQPVPLPNRP